MLSGGLQFSHMQQFWRDGYPVSTECDAAGVPVAFLFNYEWHHIIELAKLYKLSNDWWELAVAQTVYKVATDKHLLVLLFWDDVQQAWFLRRSYD